VNKEKKISPFFIQSEKMGCSSSPNKIKRRYSNNKKIMEDDIIAIFNCIDVVTKSKEGTVIIRKQWKTTF